MTLKWFALKWCGACDVAHREEDALPFMQIWLVGPFDDEKTCAAWARVSQRKAGDDPRWQAVVLDMEDDPRKIVTHDGRAVQWCVAIRRPSAANA